MRLPEEERNSADDVENYLVRTPGGEVPLGQVASASFARSAATIHRLDGRRAVTVTADVDAAVVTGQEVNRSLEDGILERLSAGDRLFGYTFGGQREQQDHANAALGQSLFLALLVMYALMAIPFGSYSQPLIILAAVPLGAIGAVAGHMLLGLSLGIWSMYGLIGVSGVVVNDSLMMIKFINDLKASGLPAREAIVRWGEAPVSRHPADVDHDICGCRSACIRNQYPRPAPSAVGRLGRIRRPYRHRTAHAGDNPHSSWCNPRSRTGGMPAPDRLGSGDSSSGRPLHRLRAGAAGGEDRHEGPKLSWPLPGGGAESPSQGGGAGRR